MHVGIKIRPIKDIMHGYMYVGYEVEITSESSILRTVAFNYFLEKCRGFKHLYDVVDKDVDNARIRFYLEIENKNYTDVLLENIMNAWNKVIRLLKNYEKWGGDNGMQDM